MPVPPPLPHLLPQNRRVRHLRGIHLRNLTFTPPRDQSVDDAEINQSPSRLDTPQQLQYSRSSENLRPEKVRRRSTILANASPLTRQKMREFALDDRACDAFFSLHGGGDQDPLYVSELGERATNFDYQFFDLREHDPRITRSSTVTVKVWVKRKDAWTLFIEETSDLRALSYIQVLPGTLFPPNTIVFHLTDGAYAFGVKNKFVPHKTGECLTSSPFNALMKLANLENSIQDALETQQTLAAQVGEILARKKPDTTPEAEEKAKLVKHHLNLQRRAVKATRKRKNDLVGSIIMRRAAIHSGWEAQNKAEQDVRYAAARLPASRETLASTQEGIRGQRRRVCEDLANIFPITPVSSGQVLSFQICGVPLPNSEVGPTTSSTVGEDALSAGLGYVATLTNALQYYLGVMLPYEINAFGSRSTIRDEISMLPASQREFPLYIPRGGSNTQYRFDYAWFLLNKDIEALCAAQGLKVVDIRHTLPNLKYLLYVCSAGNDELPERKKGGIRGLWAGRMQTRGFGVSVDEGGSVSGSRRGSTESRLLSAQQDQFQRSLAANGSGREDDAATLAAPETPQPGSFEQEPKLTLRTKGLREDVAK